MRNRRRRRRLPDKKSSADRFSVLWEGYRPDKSVPQERAARPGTGLFNGGLGAEPPTSERACFMKQALLAGYCVPHPPFSPTCVPSHGKCGYFSIQRMNVATFSRLSSSISRSFARSSLRIDPVSSRPSKNSDGLISK